MTTGGGNQAPTRLAVMGQRAEQEKSPIIYRRFAEQFGHRIECGTIDVARGTFEQAVRDFQGSGGRGLSVTVPYMLDAFRLADRVSPRAAAAGAVSVMKFEEGQIFGDSADGAGLVRDLTENLSVQLEDAHILIMGAGDPVRVVLGPLLERYPAFVTVADRSAGKAKDLVDLFSARGKVRGCGFDELTDARFDIVINAAAGGLEGGVPPLPGTVFNPGALAYDLIYSGRPTVFMEWAGTHGAGIVADGLGMLIEQAAECYELWLGTRPDTRRVLEALRKPP